MPIDESQPAIRLPASASSHPVIQRLAPALARESAMPGGVPPMFASPPDACPERRDGGVEQ